MEDRANDLLRLTRSYVPRWLYERALQAEDLGEARRVEAAVLVADMPGFSALTRQLGAEGLIGPELATERLNRWFEDVLEPARAQGGDVTTFAGDCFTAVFPGPTRATRLQAAAAAGLAIVGGGRSSARVGIADGEVWQLAVGGARCRLPLTTGAAVRDAARAMVAAGTDEVCSATPEASLELGPARDGFARVLDLGGRPRLGSFVRAHTAPASTHVAPRVVQALQPFLADAVWRSLLLPAQRGEHRSIAVVFARLGDAGPTPDGVSRAEAEALRERLAHAVGAVQRAGGYVQKLEHGDKGLVLLALFGAPVAQQDAQTRALAAACAAASTGGVAAAVTSGRVFAGDLGTTYRREFTAVGDPVNRAARLLQATPAGQTVCDPATAAAATAFEFEPAPPLAAKGFDAPLERRIVRSATATTVDERAVAEPPLVGRERELARLGRVLAGAEPGPLAIVGELGIGKSRLLREALRRAREAGRRVAVGHFGGVQPFSAFAELAVALGAPHARERGELSDALHAALAGPPLALALEDLHLADPDDLPLWAELLAAARGHALLVTARPSATAPLPEARLSVEPLPREDAGRLLRQSSATVSLSDETALVELAEGNPLFLMALARARGAGALPSSVEEAIRIQLDRLEPMPRRMLQLASVLGGVFSRASLLELAASLDRVEVEAALARLCSEGVLLDAGADCLAFVHTLEREVAYGALPFSERRALHAAALEGLDRSGRGSHGEHLVHLEALGDGLRAAAEAVGAAEEAFERGAPTRARQLAELASSRTEDPVTRCRADGVRARALAAGFDPRAAAGLALDVAARARGLGLADLALEMQGTAAEGLSWACDYDAADATAIRAEEEASRAGRDDLRCKLLKVRGWNEWGRGDYPAARAVLEQALGLGRPGGLDSINTASALATVLIRLGRYDDCLAFVPPPDRATPRTALTVIDRVVVHHRRAELDAARHAVDRMRALLGKVADRRHASLRWAESLLLELEGDAQLAAQHRRESARVSVEHGSPYDALDPRLANGIELLVAGRFAEAAEEAVGVARLAVEVAARDQEACANVLTAIAERLRGVARAEHGGVIEAAAEVAQRTQRFDLVFLQGALRALLAPPARRDAQLQRFLELCERRRDRYGERLLLHVAHHAAAAAGDAPAASRWRATLLDRLAAWGCPAWGRL